MSTKKPLVPPCEPSVTPEGVRGTGQMTPQPHLRSPWYPKPWQWGFLSGGAECDVCGRWESKPLQSDWLFGPEPPANIALQGPTATCLYCRHYGRDVSQAILASNLLIEQATKKANFWTGIIAKEKAVLAIFQFPSPHQESTKGTQGGK
jgi:hypothetical protein